MTRTRQLLVEQMGAWLDAGQDRLDEGHVDERITAGPGQTLFED